MYKTIKYHKIKEILLVKLLFRASLHAPGLHAAIAVAAGDIDLPFCRFLDEFGEERDQTEFRLPRGLRHARQHRPGREGAVEARLEERHVARGTHADVVQTVILPGSYKEWHIGVRDIKSDLRLLVVDILKGFN